MFLIQYDRRLCIYKKESYDANMLETYFQIL